MLQSPSRSSRTCIKDLPSCSSGKPGGLVLSCNLIFALATIVLTTGCGAASHRDNYWKKNFIKRPGYEGYVAQKLADTSDNGWVTTYYNDVENDEDENTKMADRNRIINGYLLMADTAYSKFAGGYNEQIAYFEIGSDLVNLGLTAASAVTPPAALLGAAATGAQGVQHSVEKNGLNSQTRFVIINRMNAIRDKQRALILKRELEKVSCPAGSVPAENSNQTVSDLCYTLEDAMRDVNEYFYLGSINKALADIDTQTAQIKTQANPTQPQGQQAAPAITSASSASFTIGTAASFTISATGTPAPTLSKTGTLPAGVSFTANNDGTATLAGTAAAGSGNTYHITITAHNGSGADATQNFTLTVQ